MRSMFGRLAVLSSALLLACASGSPAPEQSANASAWQREAALAALRSLPVDSLCGARCTVIAVDTAVRGAPSTETLDIASLPVVAHLETGDLGAARSSRRVVGVSFGTGQAPASDTLRVAMAVAGEGGGTGATPSKATVTATLLSPGSMGLLARAELVASGSTWNVGSVRYHEP